MSNQRRISYISQKECSHSRTNHHPTGNPILWRKSDPADQPPDPETGRIIADLSDTVRAFRTANGFGRGIAAPQIGDLRRIIYVRMPDGDFDGPLINPVIVNQSSKRVELWDACFSFPDLVVRVSRAAQIEVEYIDRTGEKQRLDADGDLSELLQHEIDHLDGILALDRAVSRQAFATRDEYRRQGRP